MAATSAGVILGTVGYMAPEQIRGEPADPRSDIFAVGTVLYEMVSGRRAFHGDSPADTMSAVLREQPPDLVLRTGTPPAVARIVSRCLEKDAAERFQSARDVRFALEAVTDAPDASSAAPQAANQKSIAVLPFANMSADAENQYFSDGLAEELINALTRLPGLHVASRTSAFRFRGREIDIRQIGKELGVATVLEGSVRKSGNRLRITGQLINVADGYHVWARPD
jgi:eukaryotic-like serine/threonine-protein kinase